MFRVLLIGLVLLSNSAYAQLFSYDKAEVKSSFLYSSVLQDANYDSAGFKQIKQEYPEPGGMNHDLKKKIDSKRSRRFTQSGQLHKYIQTEEDIRPEVKRNFLGLPIGGAGTPNDNTLAISNDGMIMSVINTIVTVLSSEGDQLAFGNFSSFVGGQLPNLNRAYDPKVLYDPVNDRFILVFLQGTTSADTRIVVGFSETSDATGTWNFYALNGNPLGGETWSDYPIIAQSEEDLFVTVNILRDGESWQEGFTQSVIWQVNKADGYNNEDSLRQNLFHNIKYQDSVVWSICPVMESPNFSKGTNYFLSVRPDAESNDSIFLHTLKGNLSSGNASLEIEVLTNDRKYGVPPSAYQPTEGFRLQTNDTRVLGGIKVNNKIQFVQTTSLPDFPTSGVLHSMLDLENKTVKGNYISSDTFDYAYPSIAYAGTDKNPQASVITFSHVSELDFAGTSVAFHNQLGSEDPIFSNVVSVKDGVGLINTFLADSIERWGDYTGIQTKYNEEGVIWVGGSYGNERNRNSVWVGEIKVDPTLQLEVLENRVVTFPNPLNSRATVRVSILEDQDVLVELYNMNGQLVKELYSGNAPRGESEFYFDAESVSNGLYILKLSNSDGELIAEQKLAIH